MYAKIRKFMRENREKPILGFLYRRLNIRKEKTSQNCWTRNNCRLGRDERDLPQTQGMV